MTPKTQERNAQWQKHRGVVERVFIRGTLELLTPAHFGNGDAEGLTDIPLVYDACDPTRPLLTGASIAGALRNYLLQYELGYGRAERKTGNTLAETLFGHLVRNEATFASWLIVDDALGTLPKNAPPVELRDGVAIDPKTRTIEVHKEHGQKYDAELLPAGTTFDLSFEFLKRDEENILLDALLVALEGLANSEIGLGWRKRRGLGECQISNWKVWRYDMHTPDGVLGWLAHNADSTPQETQLPSQTTTLRDARQEFRLHATFALQSSLLVRSDTGDPNLPDLVHLRSWRNDAERPILSGTTLAGVIRARALRIANTLHPNQGPELVNRMFGNRIYDRTDTPSGSNVLVRERELIREGILAEWVQSRVMLDRFTGGAYPQALFSEQAVWGKSDKRAVEVDVTLRKHARTTDTEFQAQTALLLLVLKDLWTGDLPLGGESSIGRGRLQGLAADITWQGKTYSWNQLPNGLDAPDGAELEKLVDALRDWKGAGNG